MKYISKYKSPNYNSRKNSKIKVIVIHYTALKNTSEAISYLCKKENKVSAHYLISQNGDVYNLVNDTLRAWHAGQSFWQGITDINSVSIGIELDYNPYGKNNKFTIKMINSLKKLIRIIKKKYKISKKNILAHSDIAPFRKNDPGQFFPWKSIASSKLILNLDNVTKKDQKIIKDWFLLHNIKSKKKIIILSLTLIGYDTYLVHNSPKLYTKLINAYMNRYLQNLDRKNQNLLIETLMKHLLKFSLTKN